LTYGLERLAMYVQGVDSVYDLNFNGRDGDEKVTYGEVFLQAEQEYSRHNFEHADTAILLRHFEDAERECRRCLPQAPRNRARISRCTGWFCPPTTSASRPPMPSTSSMPAA
jgi:glycyl-tRNA synthetase alpha chain